MREIKEKQRIKKILFSKPVIIFLFIILFFMISATLGVYGKYSETRQNKNTVKVNLIDLESKEVDLREEIERLNTSRGVEEDIRKNFGFVKEGEQVVIIVSDDSSLNNDRRLEDRGFFRALFNIIKNIFTP